MPSQHDVVSHSTLFCPRPLFNLAFISPCERSFPGIIVSRHTNYMYTYHTRKPNNDMHVFFPHNSSIDLESRMSCIFNDILGDGAAIISSIRNSKLHFFESVPSGMHIHKATAAYIKYFNNLPAQYTFDNNNVTDIYI